MRAAQWRSVAGGLEKNLRINDETRLPKYASPLPKDHTLVKVAYASLNHLDYKVAEILLGSTLFSKPATPGLDFSGTVVATSLSNLKHGQRVLGRTEIPACGTLAEYVVVSKAGIAALPAGVSMKEAACIGICGSTALQSLKPFVGPGSKVLINGGSGGVGVFAIQVAKTLGCAQITAVCSGKNADLCRQLGADDVIDYRLEDPVTVLKQRNQHYDHILDTVFENPNLYWQCHHFLKPKGTYVSVGLPLKFQTIKTLLAIRFLPRILGGGQRKFMFHSVTAIPEHFTQVSQWIAEGNVKPIIDDEFELEDVGIAYEKLKSGRAVGKLVIRLCGEPDLSS